MAELPDKVNMALTEDVEDGVDEVLESEPDEYKPEKHDTPRKGGRGGGGGKRGQKQANNTPNKLKGTLGKEKITKATQRQCWGCKNFFGPEGMALAMNFCHVDSSALDNIRYVSTKQGKLEWYQRMKTDDSKLEAVLKEYHKRFPDTMAEGGGPKRKKTLATVTFHMLECVICSTTTIRETEGELMWETECVAFAQTKSGGGLTDDAARAQWQRWVDELASNPDTTKLYHDQGGPTWSPLRFWVKARDRILFQESIEKQKVLQIAEKDQKNLDQASIDSLNKRLFSEHEKIGRASGSQEFDDFARNALRNAQGGGIGGSMNGKSMDIQMWSS